MLDNQSQQNKRYLLQRSRTSSSEYCIFDVLKQKIVSDGLDLQDASIGVNNRNKEWEKEKEHLLNGATD